MTNLRPSRFSDATQQDENEAIKGGRTPADWEEKPAKNRQKDKDARWTKKHGQSFTVTRTT